MENRYHGGRQARLPIRESGRLNRLPVTSRWARAQTSTTSAGNSSHPNMEVACPSYERGCAPGNPVAGREIWTVTLAERVENHKGMEIIGTAGSPPMTASKLEATAEQLRKRGFDVEIVFLDEYLPLEWWKEAHQASKDYLMDGHVYPASLFDTHEARLLIIRNGLEAFGICTEDVLAELESMEMDEQALMRGKVVQKRARTNNCICEEYQRSDIAKGKGTTWPFAKMPTLSAFRTKIGDEFGDEYKGLLAEVNKYGSAETGIGFHGDRERDIVVGVRLGPPGVTMPLDFQWYMNGKPVHKTNEGGRYSVPLRSGDMYVMSFKATGKDCKKSTWPTLRHAAGHEKYRPSNEMIHSKLEAKAAKKAEKKRKRE